MSDMLSHLSNEANKRRERVHFVYQIWSRDTCLYVGITSNLGQRLTAHARKDWWEAATRVEASIQPDKYSALDVERDLIQELDPWVNRQSRL